MAQRFLLSGGKQRTGANAPKFIMKRDSAAIYACDTVVALLDGPKVDGGTACDLYLGQESLGGGNEFRLSPVHH